MRAILAALLLFPITAMALTIEQKLPDAAQEQIAETSFHALKCVVCEGQSIADSDASFAAQMRAEIRRMASEGQSEQQILDYFSDHYGTRILLNPPLERDTVPLWLGPFIMLCLGAAGIAFFTRRRNLPAAESTDHE